MGRGLSVSIVLCLGVVVFLAGFWYGSAFVAIAPPLSPLGEMNELAEQDGIPIETVAICTDEYDPVCGSDGVTYSNTCRAQQAGVSVVAESACGVQ